MTGFTITTFSGSPSFDGGAYLLAVATSPPPPTRNGSCQLRLECPTNRTRLARVGVRRLDHYTCCFTWYAKHTATRQQRSPITLRNPRQTTNIPAERWRQVPVFFWWSWGKRDSHSESSSLWTWLLGALDSTSNGRLEWISFYKYLLYHICAYTL